MLVLVYAERGKWNIRFLDQDMEQITQIIFTRPVFLATVRKLFARLAQFDHGMVAGARRAHGFEKLISEVQILRRAQRLVL
jgi:hypothetical protein